MEETHSTPKSDYTSRQRAAGEIFYVFLVAACILSLVGLVWSILDFFMPTGKFDAFLSMSLGLQIVIIAGFLAGLFFLLIFFFGLFKRGRKWILRFLFKKREIEEKYRNRTDVKIAAGGLLVSLIAIVIGLIIAFVQGLSGDPSSGLGTFLSLFSTGNWILFAGIALFFVLIVGVLVIYFIKHGYYLILKIMGVLEKEAD